MRWLYIPLCLAASHLYRPVHNCILGNPLLYLLFKELVL